MLANYHHFSPNNHANYGEQHMPYKKSNQSGVLCVQTAIFAQYHLWLRYLVCGSSSPNPGQVWRSRTCQIYKHKIRQSLFGHVYVCVCVFGRAVGRQGSLALAGSLSRKRKTLIQNRGLRSPLASSGTSVSLSMWWPYSPIVLDLPCHWVLSMFRWRRGTTGRDVFSR